MANYRDDDYRGAGTYEDAVRRTSQNHTHSEARGSGSYKSSSYRGDTPARRSPSGVRSSGANHNGAGHNGSGRRKKKRRRRIRLQPRFYLLLAIVLVVIAVFAVVLTLALKSGDDGVQEPEKTPKPGIFSELFKTPTPSPTPSPSPTPTPTPTPPYAIPHAVEGTEPSKFGIGVKVEVDGAEVGTYSRKEEINFGYTGDYTELPGVITFRGNTLRTQPAFGLATVSSRKLTSAWSIDTGELGRSDVSGPTDRTWTGSGWVGQPLIVQWPEATKQVMNLYDSAKQKAGLVEVIYATMDGNIYFIDLATGKPTRDKLFLNMPFKGAGALDPRGYPILYLGSGDMYLGEEQKARAMAISLIDFTRLYEFGKQNDPFALRDWHAYDSSPLVDAETDTLVYPGENGILYTIKLNTEYNEAAGTLTMHPGTVVKMRYAGSRSTYPASSTNTFWLGYESSVAVLGGYAYLGTNDGFLQCIDLNTMSIVWVQDVKDDCNGSPVIELDETNHKAYIYIGPSLHFIADADKRGTIPFMKVDAETGEIVWKYEESVITKSGVSGGIQATALLGQKSISDLVIIPFARTPEENSGKLVALDKNTMDVRWTYSMEKYTWSSPLAIYDESGNAYIVVCEGSDTGDRIFLLDGKTGTLLDSFDSQKNIEASPAAYNDMIVVGTRGMKILGVRIY